jgi:hypothetical protein
MAAVLLGADQRAAPDWVQPFRLGVGAAALAGSSLAAVASSDDRSGPATGQPDDPAVSAAAERPL